MQSCFRFPLKVPSVALYNNQLKLIIVHFYYIFFFINILFCFVSVTCAELEFLLIYTPASYSESPECKSWLESCDHFLGLCVYLQSLPSGTCNKVVITPVSYVWDPSMNLEQKTWIRIKSFYVFPQYLCKCCCIFLCYSIQEVPVLNFSQDVGNLSKVFHSLPLSSV
jgi:hypothetical protein